LTGETRIKFMRLARGKIKFIKRKSLQKYRQKAGRFADENFILNLARGAGKFDAQKGAIDQIYARDKIKFSAQNTIKFNQKAA
jgi:hypothetical protein